MGNRVFLFGLPFSASETEIKEFVKSHGVPVDAVSLPVDRATGRARGFGFVTVPTDTDRDDLIKILDGAIFQGRTIGAREARPR